MVENISAVIAENLKRLREERKLSLEAVARLSGVSKSMLAQIERGDVNPTVSTVWKIAKGLKLSFTDLMTRPEAEAEAVDKNAIEPLVENEGKFRNYPLFPFDGERRFEVFAIELDGGALLKAEPHPAGTQEFVTVFSGRLTVSAGGRDFALSEGGALRFRADTPHAYENTGDEVCRLSMVIWYPES